MYNETFILLYLYIYEFIKLSDLLFSMLFFLTFLFGRKLKLFQLQESACIRICVAEFTLRPPRGASAFPPHPFTLARELHVSRCIRRIVLSLLIS